MYSSTSGTTIRRTRGRYLPPGEGGLASHGGAIGIIIAVILFSIFTTKRNPLWTFDRLTIAIALVACLIRIGNLMNSEIFGIPTELPWGFKFVRSEEWHRLYYGLACHPTQIYEALTYLALFGLMMWMYWKKTAENARAAFRHIPDRHLRLALPHRVYQERPGSFRGCNGVQHGAAAEHTLRLIRYLPYCVALLTKREAIAYPNCFAPSRTTNSKR